MAVYPVNDPALVNRFGELLSVDLDTPISLVNIDGKFSCGSKNKMPDYITFPFFSYRGFVQEASVPLPMYFQNSSLLLPRHHVQPSYARLERIG